MRHIQRSQAPVPHRDPRRARAGTGAAGAAAGERTRGYFPPAADFMVDLDGDGRDEVVVWYDNRLLAWGSDLKDRWSVPARDWQVRNVLPASPGRASTLVLPLATAIDGKSGEVRWTYKPSSIATRYAGELLDPGNSEQLPRLIFSRNPLFWTICRSALPATPRRRLRSPFRCKAARPAWPATTRGGRVGCPG